MSIYRFVQEGVNNVLKHAVATHAAVRVLVQAHTLHLTIEDDGQGSEAGAAPTGERYGGFGLLGITERVRLLDGTHTVDSTPGSGTKISIRLPYERGVNIQP